MPEVFEHRPVWVYEEDIGSPVKESVFEYGGTQRRLSFPANKLIHIFRASYVLSATNMQAIREFHARHGMETAFWYRNWNFYEKTADAVGTGDGSQTKFTVRHYPTKTGTVVVYFDGTPQGAGWSIDHATGAITFTSAPGSGVVVTADYEFYHICVFSIDEVQSSFFMVDRYNAELTIEEVAPSRC